MKLQPMRLLQTMEVSEPGQVRSDASEESLSRPDVQQHRRDLVLFAVVCVLALFALLRPLVIHLTYSGDHYVYLAYHFARGDLSVDTLPAGYQDYVVWQGHKYL